MDNLSTEEEVRWWVAYEQFPFAEYWVCPGCGMENDRAEAYARTVACGGCPAQIPWPFPRREDQPDAEETGGGPLPCMFCCAEACVVQSPGLALDVARVACADCYLSVLNLGHAPRPVAKPKEATSSGGAPCPRTECHTPCDEGGDAIAVACYPRKVEKRAASELAFQ
jgi:hypothetical protein